MRFSSSSLFYPPLALHWASNHLVSCLFSPALLFPFCFSLLLFAASPPWLVVCFAGLLDPLLGPPCASAAFVVSAWPLPVPLRLRALSVAPPALVCVARVSSRCRPRFRMFPLLFCPCLLSLRWWVVVASCCPAPTRVRVVPCAVWYRRAVLAFSLVFCGAVLPCSVLRVVLWCPALLCCGLRCVVRCSLGQLCVCCAVLCCVAGCCCVLCHVSGRVVPLCC